MYSFAYCLLNNKRRVFTKVLVVFTGSFPFFKCSQYNGILLTGHGKSPSYQMAVLLAEEMKTKYQPVVVVVSPLKFLIADQMRKSECFGLSSHKLEAGNVDTLTREFQPC